MKPISTFYAPDGCGCGSTPISNTSCGSASQWCDERFGALPSTSRLAIIGVAEGSICAGKFTAARGFVFCDGSATQFITSEPQISLTRINPEAGGSFPATGTFPALVCAVGADPLTWRMAQAPTTGKWRLETDSGVFKWVSGTSIPGLDSVCGQVSTVAAVGVFGCAINGDDEEGNPIFSMRRLNTPKNQPLAGYEDDDGNRQVRAVPLNEPLQHPLTSFGRTQTTEFVETDPASVVDPKAPYASGLPELAAEGVVISDCELVVYSTAKKKFFRAPARLSENISNTTLPGTTVALTGGYVSIPNHFSFGSKTFNYPNYMVTFDIGTNSVEKIVFGLHVDGMLVKEWDFTNSTDINTSPASYSASAILKGITLGAHTVEIKIRGTTGSAKVQFTNATLRSLP